VAVYGLLAQPGHADQFQAKSLDAVQRAVQGQLIQHGSQAIRRDVKARECLLPLGRPRRDGRRW
jgi:hypothetical protein